MEVAKQNFDKYSEMYLAYTLADLLQREEEKKRKEEEEEKKQEEREMQGEREG